MYATRIDGAPVPAPNPLHIGGRVIHHPPGEVHQAAGYLPIAETPYPYRLGRLTAEQVRSFAPKWITAERAEETVGSAVGEDAI